LNSRILDVDHGNVNLQLIEMFQSLYDRNYNPPLSSLQVIGMRIVNGLSPLTDTGELN